MAGLHGTKLIVLGLPWAADEDSLWSHFSQFGSLSTVEIIRDKQTGNSRGFGFINFDDMPAAEVALSSTHTIGGRRCDVKPAVPKGDRPFMRTRRIFVARIPLHVTEKEFHEHFGKFGRMDDAYMPKDHTRQKYRGIGFVTYADASSVDRVMAVKHRLGDVDIVVDCATPKDAQAQESGPNIGLQQEHGYPQDQGQFPPSASSQDSGPERHPHLGVPSRGLVTKFSGLQAAQFENQQRLFHVLREQQQYMAENQTQGDAINVGQAPVSMSEVMLPPSLLPEQAVERTSSDLAAAMNSLSHEFDALNHSPQGMPIYPGVPGSPGRSGSQEAEARGLPATGQPMSARQPQSVHSIGSSQGGGDTSRVIEVRNGPRLFVGKLTKETIEQDLREHFTKFGYVMDVFMPRARENKKEHRGFGFVTFETEAAIQRVVAYGTHLIRDSVIAIDVAVPEGPGSVSDSRRHHFDIQSGGEQFAAAGRDRMQGGDDISRDSPQVWGRPH